MGINIKKIEHGSLIEKDHAKVLDNKQKKDLCAVYKTEKCIPNKIQFNACLTCSLCTALLPEIAVKSIFNKIRDIAIMLINIFGK